MEWVITGSSFRRAGEMLTARCAVLCRAVCRAVPCCAPCPAGDNAEIGKINKLVSQVENVKTNLLVQMEILGRWLAIIVVLIAVGAFLLALLHAHEPFAEAFKSAVAISVAMIPEGLPGAHDAGVRA
jgi:hypothetical protein